MDFSTAALSVMYSENSLDLLSAESSACPLVGAKAALLAGKLDSMKDENSVENSVVSTAVDLVGCLATKMAESLVVCSAAYWEFAMAVSWADHLVALLADYLAVATAEK